MFDMIYANILTALGALDMNQEVYNSSTHGKIPLSFTSRRLMANLREAIQGAIKKGDYNTGCQAVAHARGDLAKRLSELEDKTDKPYAGQTVHVNVDFESRSDIPLFNATTSCEDNIHEANNRYWSTFPKTDGTSFVLLRPNGTIAASADTLTALFDCSQFDQLQRIHGNSRHLAKIGWKIKRVKIEFVNKPVTAAEVGTHCVKAANLADYVPVPEQSEVNAAVHDLLVQGLRKETVALLDMVGAKHASGVPADSRKMFIATARAVLGAAPVAKPESSC